MVKNNNFIIAAVGKWNKVNFDKFSKKLEGVFYLAQNNTELIALLKIKKPICIYFIHWRWHVPKKILNKHKCICFHMTDLPFGRGGSPLQNLIIRGHTSTKLSCLLMTEKMDEGPIYFKRKLDLRGSAEEIYLRMSKLSWKMINRHIKSKKLIPKKQQGKVVKFKRRHEKDSLIPSNLSNRDLYDFIRMLDASGYPRAFLYYNNKKITLTNAILSDKRLTFKAEINE